MKTKRQCWEKQANKVMLMAGTAYNLKKYLKFIQKKTVSKAETLKASFELSFEQLLGCKMSFQLLKM